MAFRFLAGGESRDGDPFLFLAAFRSRDGDLFLFLAAFRDGDLFLFGGRFDDDIVAVPCGTVWPPGFFSRPSGRNMDIAIRRFDPSKMADNATCMVIGKRNTGKSVLTKDVLYHKRHIPLGVVMSGTEEGNGWYKSWVPDTFVYNEFDKDALEKVVKRLRVLAKRGKKQSTYVVLDDCMFDKRIMKERVIRQVFMNGRHWGIFLVVTSQYVADVPPDIRTNCDYVFVTRENIQQNRERLWRMYFGIFPTREMFDAVLTSCTEDYACLVLDNTAVKSNRIEDCVFWYRARPDRDFKMGGPLTWHYHSRVYNPRYDDELEDAAAARRKQRKLRVVMKK